MKKLLVGLLSAIALVLSASPARADWQFTQWGMSKEEFKQASPVPVEDSIEKCEAFRYESSTYSTSIWEAGELKFSNCYDFDQDGKLNRVHMNLNNPWFSQKLSKALIGKYGKPFIKTEDKKINLEIYEWQTENNKITFFSYIGINSNVYVEYESIEQTVATESKL